jgi:hypothetical protein
MLKYYNAKVVNVEDWDSLVEATYGRVYSLQQQAGCKERGIEYFKVPVNSPEDYECTTIPEEINGRKMGVSFATWSSREPLTWEGNPDDRGYLDLFWKRNFYPCLEVVAQDLYIKGLIPQGDYVITIDW